MSILLESLKQKQPTSPSDIPSVDDSHFDDEMLSDEWLLKRLSFWKMVSALLSLTLISSWLMLYFYPGFLLDEKKTKQSLIVQSGRIHETKPAITLTERKDPPNNQQKTPILAEDKAIYHPKKISIDKPMKTDSKNNNTKADKKTSEKANKKIPFEQIDTEKTVEFESLSQQLIDEMPEIEINSYTVSSNPSKSFVVLNDVFYGIGETIAPHLVLIAIDKSGIVVRYKKQLIRKKFNK